MKDIWEVVLNPAWWFGTVIVAFLINLASDYSKPAIDRLLSGFSRARREANEEKKHQFEQHLSRLMSDPNEVMLVEIQYSRSIMQAGFSFVALLIASLVQAVATELRLFPYLDFMSDATIIIQMFLKSTTIFSFFSIILLLCAFFSVVMFIASNRRLLFLRELLSEYHRQEQARHAK